MTAVFNITVGALLILDIIALGALLTLDRMASAHDKWGGQS